jgi:hypothetical protein
MLTAIPPVVKPKGLIGIQPIAKLRTMPIGFPPIAYQEPNHLDLVNQPNPNQPYHN